MFAKKPTHILTATFTDGSPLDSFGSSAIVYGRRDLKTRLAARRRGTARRDRHRPPAPPPRPARLTPHRTRPYRCPVPERHPHDHFCWCGGPCP
ncbi:hypothetical protein FrCorBMG51_10310 [Protofrankia coriariae]|uniref:Uncharacterized protein n=1 Tax=Protofrankia coriariae TaxID=1562887 RepID=A0ABR5F430_9ACTN|nr:hypothetical protein FrCorBMG51_10310 [Protofrankia coriariae]